MTHSLADVFQSDMGPMLVESCPVRFYLANPEASIPTIRTIYQQIGLEDTAIAQIAVMRPQRDIYYQLRGEGQRPFSLAFSRFMLDCLARNTAEDHRLMEEILQKEGREGFLAGWLRHHNYQDEVEDYGDE
jgi:type IV secretion system protein VirB4